MARKPVKPRRATPSAQKTAPARKPAAARTVAAAPKHPVRQPSPSPTVKPTVILVGADKGGVGKSTVARFILDFLGQNRIRARAFDTEAPRGTLYHFHPDETTIVDLTSTSDQMKIFDTLMTSPQRVSVIDVRAGGLTPVLATLEEIGFFDAVKAGEFGFILLHILGPSLSSLDEIDVVAPYVRDADYFIVKNHVNDSTFFEWDPHTHSKYFENVRAAGEITVPQLDAQAYEKVEVASTPFSTFVADRTADGQPAHHSFVLKGKVYSWLNRVAEAFENVGILDLLAVDKRGR
jgi:hypothetical protein